MTLVARTFPVTDPGGLLAYLPEDGCAWMRHGNGLIGIGVAACWTGTDMVAAAAWWQDFVASIEIADADQTALGPNAGGPIAFGTFPFDPSHTAATGRLIVPQTVLRHRNGQTLVTTFGGELSPAAPIRPQQFQDGFRRSITQDHWCDVVSAATSKIRSNGLSKVVLARALTATATEAIDPRAPFASLVADYPSCWSFLVDGFVGASPEMLLRREGGLVTSRVLAGTIRRVPGREGALAQALESSDKDLIEHEYAVASVASALAPHCSGMNVPDAPYVLQLPNVLHLASDVTGVASSGASSLELAAALHPSAAVCGTPTDDARAYIATNERLDRGRYSGPVGWMDAAGDGEWCIGLRSGQLADDRRSITIFAGCGIVADSVAADELAETRAKFVPMLTALGLANG